MAEIIIRNIESNGLELRDEGDKLHVQYNGHVINTEIYSGAEIHVSAGGTASITSVYSSGFMYVSEGGIATSTHLRPSAWMEVFSGGTANATVVDSQSDLIVYSGGTATVTYNLWGGNVISSAGAKVTYLYRDAGIYYGGNDAGLVNSGDAMDGLVIAENHSAVVFGENYAYIDGSPVKTANAGILNNAIVTSRSYLHISNGGLANSAIVANGGEMYVSSGGSAHIGYVGGNIVISRGGTVDGIDITGSMNLQNGGSAYDTTIAVGGMVNGFRVVSNNSYASGLTISHADVTSRAAYLYKDQYASGKAVYDFNNKTLRVSQSYLAGLSIVETRIPNGANDPNGAEVEIKTESTLGQDVIPSLGVDINRSGTLHISSGGVAENAFVHENGTILVSNGGIASNTLLAGSRFAQITSSGNLVYSGYLYNGIIPTYGGSPVLNDPSYTNLYYNQVTNCTFTYPFAIVSTWLRDHAVMEVHSGGLVNSTHVEFGGSLTILSSGIARGISVKGSSWHYWNILQNGARVSFEAGTDYGYIHVNGGSAYSTDIYTYGLMSVYNGGIANSTFVSAGGTMYIENGGFAKNTFVSSTGNIHISSGGKVDHTVANYSGYIHLSAGGSALNTVVSSGGTAHISGGRADSSWVLSSGVMTVYGGGQAGGTESSTKKVWWSNGVVVNSDGVLNVKSGGSAYVIYNPWSGTVISNTGAEIHYQRIDEVTGVYYGGQAPGLVSLEDSMTRLEITSGYSAMVFREGELNEATLNEETAYLHVYHGGKVTNTTAVTSSVVNGFTLQENNYYESGIHISNAYVGSRVLGALYDGQTATNITVNLHGSLYIEGGARITSSFFDSGAVINGFTISESNENANTIRITSAIASSGVSAFVFEGQTIQATSAQAGVVINGFKLQEGNYYENGLTISKGIVGSNVSAFVYSGQTASDNTINNGGAFTVYSGGAAYETTLNGTMEVAMAGFASGITVSSGGVMTVVNGGTVADIKVNTGARVTLASGASINGFLLQRTNTYTNNIVISSAVVNAGITTELYEGINAKGVTISSYGKMRVYNNGWTSNTKIMSAGELHLSSGGKAIATTVSSGGIVHVFSGAAASRTTLLDGSYLGVGNGGNLYETTISSGGGLTLWMGGSAVSNTILNGGNLMVSCGAIVKDNVISSGGGLHVYSGGLAASTYIAQGAFLGVGNGGVASGNTVGYCGEVIVWGGGLVDTNTVDTWGAIILSSGAGANSTTIKANAGLHIYSGATAYSTEITSGANLGVGLGGVLYNAKSYEGAEIKFYDGAFLRGWNEFSGTVTIQGDINADGSYIVFDLNNRADATAAILNNAAAVREAQFFLTENVTTADGQYMLADNATGFLGMTIGLTGSDIKLDIGGATVNHNGKNYTAGVTDGRLWVDIRTSYGSGDLMDWQEEDPLACSGGLPEEAGAAPELFREADAAVAAGCIDLDETPASITGNGGTPFLAVI